MFWDGFRSRDYGEHEFTGPKECRINTVCRHDGPVWQLAWAHPVYGSVLATCGYDRKVILWKEQDSGWSKIYEYSNHDSSGNDCQLVIVMFTVMNIQTMTRQVMIDSWLL